MRARRSRWERLVIAAALLVGPFAAGSHAGDRWAFEPPVTAVDEGWWLSADGDVRNRLYASEVGARSLWAHDGERLVLETLDRGDTRIWLYAGEPGERSPPRGTRLFLGRIEADGSMKGSWSLHEPSCGALPFPVGGAVTDGGNAIELAGTAPTVGPRCGIGAPRDWSLRLVRMGDQPFLPDTPYEEDAEIDPFPGIPPYGYPLVPRSGGEVAFHASEALRDTVGAFAAADAEWRAMTLADYRCEPDVDWRALEGDEAQNVVLERCVLRVVFDRHDGWVRGAEMRIDWSAWE